MSTGACGGTARTIIVWPALALAAALLLHIGLFHVDHAAGTAAAGHPGAEVHGHGHHACEHPDPRLEAAHAQQPCLAENAQPTSSGAPKAAAPPRLAPVAVSGSRPAPRSAFQPLTGTRRQALLQRFTL